MTRSRDDSGAAVAVALGLVAVLVLVTAVCVGTVAIVLAHRRAQAAADLASLAAAGARQRGVEPCAAASRIAVVQGAEVIGCVVDGESVMVTTAVDLPPALGGGRMSARARAGPASAGAWPRDLHRASRRTAGTSTVCARSC